LAKAGRGGGSILGVPTSCLLAIYFTEALHIRGAVLPFAETLLYSGYGHLDLQQLSRIIHAARLMKPRNGAFESVQ